MIWLLACGAASTEPVGDGPCARYTGEAAAWCAVAESATAEDIAACDAAGAFQAECRLRWVHQHLATRPADELLAACVGDEECLFDVIDGTPAPLLEQLERCDALPTIASFCQEHAALRWIDAGHPDLDAVAADARWPDAIGRALGHVHACDGGPACDTLAPPLQAPCQALADEVAAAPATCSR